MRRKGPPHRLDVDEVHLQLAVHATPRDRAHQRAVVDPLRRSRVRSITRFRRAEPAPQHRAEVLRAQQLKRSAARVEQQRDATLRRHSSEKRVRVRGSIERCTRGENVSEVVHSGHAKVVTRQVAARAGSAPRRQRPQGASIGSSSIWTTRSAATQCAAASTTRCCTAGVASRHGQARREAFEHCTSRGAVTRPPSRAD